MQIILLNKFADWPDGVERNYPLVALRRDTWNDYGFETLFKATYYPTQDEETAISLGGVKIAPRGLKSSDPAMRAQLSGAYPGFEQHFISLGQSTEYYEKLAELGGPARRAYAEAMRDIPLLDLSRDELESEDVFRISFLRTTSAQRALDFALDRFVGRVELVNSFVLETQLKGARGAHLVPFDFEPGGGLPHRVNVLVGVNGVGKTQLMANLAVLLSRFERSETTKSREKRGESFEALGSLTPRPSLYGVLSVSFSAFDDFALPSVKEGKDFLYTYCGLRRRDGVQIDVKKIASRIPSAIEKMSDEQKRLFREALRMVIPGQDFPQGAPVSASVYKRLSAGQRIVLNIVCDIVLNLRTRSLVLLDEPEVHLHPQLLTTLLTILNEMLEGFDSFAIIATHSPIVVQQVPSRRVHVVRRPFDDVPNVTSPHIETFGENLSEIVRVVFDANESDRDYQAVLDQLLADYNNDPDRVEALFGGKLGSGLVDQSQNSTVAARARAEKNTVGQRS
ncbi:AAA family ATPase [Novosphingobium sp. 11B]